MRRSLLLTVFLALALASCSTVSITGQKFDLEHTGKLARNMTGYAPGVWYLVKDGSASVADATRLSFDEDVQCIEGGRTSDCQRSVYKQDLRVTVRGEAGEDGEMLVQEMEILTGTGGTASGSTSR